MMAMATDIGFENEKARRENARLRSLLKPGQKYCPTCGQVTDKKNEICAYCQGKDWPGRIESTIPR